MVYTNDIGVTYPSTFVNKVLAVYRVKDKEKRILACKGVSKSEAETGAIKYLVKCPYWEEFGSVCQIPRFSTLNSKIIIKWRCCAKDAPVCPSSVNLFFILRLSLDYGPKGH